MTLLIHATKVLAEQTAAEIVSVLVKKGATDTLTNYLSHTPVVRSPKSMWLSLEADVDTAPGEEP